MPGKPLAETRLDEILAGGGPLMAPPRPAMDPFEVRRAVEISIEQNGIHDTAAHHEAVLNRCGPRALHFDDEVKRIIAEAIGYAF